MRERLTYTGRKDRESEREGARHTELGQQGAAERPWDGGRKWRETGEDRQPRRKGDRQEEEEKGGRHPQTERQAERRKRRVEGTPQLC